MRGSRYLLANVQPSKFLESGAPTGLTGLLTHPRPRPTLIYTYNQTLKKLQAIPKSSVYRQSTEAITKARLKIVQDAKPAGYERWLSRIKAEIAKHPSAYSDVTQEDGSVAIPEPKEKPTEDNTGSEVYQEGGYSEEAANRTAQAINDAAKEETADKVPDPSELEPEPPLDAEQINAIETKIGAGLIEEVIEVAEGELQLIDEMGTSKIWESLEERPAPGQWEYFERATHTGKT